jgi:hypothetical protein
MNTVGFDVYADAGQATGRLLGIVMVIALVIFGIIAIVRNNARVRRAAQSGATAPANWYPDPEVPSQMRYWDGTQWTDHRQPKPPN